MAGSSSTDIPILDQGPIVMAHEYSFKTGAISQKTQHLDLGLCFVKLIYFVLLANLFFCRIE